VLLEANKLLPMQPLQQMERKRYGRVRVPVELSATARSSVPSQLKNKVIHECPALSLRRACRGQGHTYEIVAAEGAA
jgi:hypothetical protein